MFHLVPWSMCEDLPQKRAANGKKEYSICLLQLFYMNSFNCSSNFVLLQIEAKEWHVAFHHVTYYKSERVPVNKLVFGLHFGLVTDFPSTNVIDLWRTSLL